MKKSVRLFSIFTILAIALSSTISAGAQKPEPPSVLIPLQLLAFNDYHGFLEAGGNPGPGTIGTPRPAGGGEFLSTKLKELRAGKQNTLTVAAGDLIGGSPFLSGSFPR